MGFGIIKDEGKNWFLHCENPNSILGLSKLYFGMSPAIYRHMIYTTFRMSAYQYIRPMMGTEAPLYQKALLGLFCGGTGQLLANPFDLVKVQMQAEGRRKMQGLPPRVKVDPHNFR